MEAAPIDRKPRSIILSRELPPPRFFGSGGVAVQRARLDLALKLHTLRETRIELAADRTDEVRWATLLILGLMTQLAIASVHLETPRPQIAALTIFSITAIIGLGLVAIE